MTCLRDECIADWIDSNQWNLIDKTSADEICISWFKSEWAMGRDPDIAWFRPFEPLVTPGLYELILLKKEIAVC